MSDKIKEEIKKPPRPEKKPFASRNKSDGIRENSLSKDNFVVFKDKSESDGIIIKEKDHKEVKDKCVSKSREGSLNKGNSKKFQIKEKKEGKSREVSIVKVKEICFVEQAKETSSQRGRSMNRRVTRKVILHSNSLVPKHIDI